jgi:AcrR family transcriptional regulator
MRTAPSGVEAVLDATESLLAERRLEDLTVVDLAQAAGVSRATFYTYFENKHGVVAALAESVMEQIHTLWHPWLSGQLPREELGPICLESVALWRRHRSVLMAAAQAWRADAAVSDAWATMMRGYAGTVRGYLDAAWEGDSAAAEPDAGTLAAVLVWLNESALYLAFDGDTGGIDDDRRLASTLAAVWLRAIHDPPVQLARAGLVPACAPPDRRPPFSRPARHNRPGTPEIRRAILHATGELLRDCRLEELTVVHVIEAAGVSRPTFYLNFESKHAVVATLAEHALNEIYEQLWGPWLEGEEPSTTPMMIEHYLKTFARWRRDSAVLVAAAQGWRSDPVAYAAWGECWQQYVSITAGYIERARIGGMAPADPDAETLASVLVWLSETLLYLAFSDSVPELVADRSLAAAMATVWLRSIHGRAGDEGDAGD